MTTRVEVVAQAMTAGTTGNYETWEDLAASVLAAIDAYDIKVLVESLQQHVKIPLPTIIDESVPKTQFDYMVEVLEGALKARLLTQIVRLPLDNATELMVRQTIMETP